MTKSEIIALINSNPRATFDLDMGDNEIIGNVRLTVAADIDPNDHDTLNPIYIEVLRDLEGTVYYLSDVVEVRISKKK